MDKTHGYRKIPENPAPKDRKKRELSPGEKQQMMIRELQGVFCKGRYRSWAMGYNGGME
jgi:hypothetical protein